MIALKRKLTSHIASEIPLGGGQYFDVKFPSFCEFPESIWSRVSVWDGPDSGVCFPVCSVSVSDLSGFGANISADMIQLPITAYTLCVLSLIMLFITFVRSPQAKMSTTERSDLLKRVQHEARTILRISFFSLSRFLLGISTGFSFVIGNLMVWRADHMFKISIWYKFLS